MPVPHRDDGKPGPTRHLLVFVHGFASSAQTWKPMLDRLHEDERITALFDLEVFSYTTSMASLPMVRRLPALQELGRALGGFLDRELIGDDGFGKYIDTTLVGHSMGGLVIQSYLALCLDQGKGLNLDRFRQVILFATPSFGATIAKGLRKIASWIQENPQERALRLFSPESRAIHEAIHEKVILAKRRDTHEYPLPFFCFWGQSDGLVPEANARGHFSAGQPLPGDHFSVHQPRSTKDEGYRAFVDLVFHPNGHESIWEIETSHFKAQVRPLPPGTEQVVHHGGKHRVVASDNEATVTRSVVFSRNNHCKLPYLLKYGTRNGGFIEPSITDPHLTSPDKLRIYDDNGTDAFYEVPPDPGRKSVLKMRVLRGFDRGHRDFHLHLGRTSYFRHACFEVDLVEYLKAGWTVRTPPTLYYHPIDSGDHTLCAQRQMLHPDPAHQIDPSGIWSWELEFVKEGVVDVGWELNPPTVRSDPQTISLQPGEHVIFGYGSLLSKASLERTLGHKYIGPLLVCEIEGWRRSWDVTMPDSSFIYRDSDEWISPERIIYLNIAPSAKRSVNGVVFVVGDDDLARLDRREWIYDRADVTADLRGAIVTGGAAWAYVAKPEHLLVGADSPRNAAVRSSYLAILETGHRELGPAFGARYEATTDPVPAHLVIDDVRRHDIVDS